MFDYFDNLFIQFSMSQQQIRWREILYWHYECHSYQLLIVIGIRLNFEGYLWLHTMPVKMWKIWKAQWKHIWHFDFQKMVWHQPQTTIVALTLSVRGASYLGLIRSISWPLPLMSWLLTSPRHQQPWYWLYRICRSFSYLRKDLSTCVISTWKNDTKCKNMFMFPLKILARKG